MKPLAIHPSTQQQIAKYLNSPAHAVILVGPHGSGKSYVARRLTEHILGSQNLDSETNKGRLLQALIEDTKSEISIDTIRRIIRQLSRKAPGSRVVMIENASLMSLEAQNALLKTLEQPGGDIYFILTTTSQSSVLATIYSRAATINIRPISLDQANKHYQAMFSDPKIEKAWQLSEGRSHTLDSLLEGGQSDVIDMIELAKKFLGLKPYERLLELDDLSKDRYRLKLFLEALQRVLKAVHHNSLKSSAASAPRLLASRKTVNEALKKLETNTSPKLLQLDLLTHLTV